MAPVLDQSRLTGLICHCRKVPYDDVEAVIGAGRATTLADIQRETTACTRCFGCRFEIERMLDVHALLEEHGTVLPGGIGTLKVVLDADRVASLRPYFQLITPGGITSTHEKGSPRSGRITKPRGYHWIFPVGYADEPGAAYFF